MIHISTDYVFDGSGSSLYTEDMPIAPIGVYGKTKAAVEFRQWATRVLETFAKQGYVLDNQIVSHKRKVLEEILINYHLIINFFLNSSFF